MPAAVAFTLLVVALVLPVVGALALRLLGPRLSERQFTLSAVALLCAVVASVLALARGPLSGVQVGGLALLTPSGSATDVDIPLPVPVGPPPDPDAPHDHGAPAEPVPTTVVFLPLTAALSATAALTDTLAAYPGPTGAPDDAPAASPAPEPPTEEPEPPAEEPEPPAEPAQRTYTVEPGDTLRGIAEQFGVSVEDLLAANNLTPEDADALQQGQELVIP